MPAANKEFPWLSYYRHYNFFERRMNEHNKVKNLTKVGTGLYDINLINGTRLRAFICECYSFGGAEYQETVQKLGKVDAVVIDSNWCGYSFELKLLCQQEQVGIFDIAGFMAALNLKNFWEYMTERERERIK